MRRECGAETRRTGPDHRPRCRGAQELGEMEPEASADSQIMGPELGASRQSRRQRRARLGWEEGIRVRGITEGGRASFWIGKREQLKYLVSKLKCYRTKCFQGNLKLLVNCLGRLGPPDGQNLMNTLGHGALFK